MNKTVYFTGTLPKKGEAPFGGGEVGNVRTIRMLQSFGYHVVSVRRSRSGAKESMIKKRLAFPFRVLSSILRWFFVLLFGHRKSSIAHISGFYGSTIIIEVLQVFIAQLTGYRIIYELRGGGASLFYEKGTRLYKNQFKYILNKADYLFSQGKENELLLKTVCNTPVIYYPNCVQQSFCPEKMPEKPVDKINLFFFGRIEKEKNPFLIVEIAALLQEQFPSITLTILGNGQNSIIARIESDMKAKLKAGSFQLLPGCEHEELKAIFADKHFYIFPSEQPREGQSNAVTEVMAYGIIPIASPQGFNRSTIGDNRLIVEELSAGAYADRIATIIKNREIEKYAHFVRKRFIENFSEQVVFERVEKDYAELFCGY